MSIFRNVSSYNSEILDKIQKFALKDFPYMKGKSIRLPAFIRKPESRIQFDNIQ